MIYTNLILRPLLEGRDVGMGREARFTQVQMDPSDSFNAKYTAVVKYYFPRSWERF